MDRVYHIFLALISFVLGGGAMYVYVLITGKLPGKK